MDVSALLHQCEKLSSTERSKRMVELGRLSRKDLAAKQVIAELFGKTLYEQHLSLETCYGSRDIQIAIRALTSSSSHLRKRAISVIILVGTDDEVLGALRELPLYAQIEAFHRMRCVRPRRRRQQVIDNFLDGIKDWDAGDERVYHGLLFLGSKSVVETHFPKIIDRCTATDWARLGRFHPEIARDALLDWASRSGTEDYRLMSTINSLLKQWGNSDENADMCLMLVPELLQRLSIRLSRLYLNGLLIKRPTQMVRMILDTEDEVNMRYTGEVLTALSIEDLLRLQERYSPVSPSNFSQLHYAQRLAVYNLVRLGWRSKDGVFPMNVLLQLPIEERIEEARRHVKLRAFDAKPWLRIPYIALLPWEEALEMQWTFIKSTDADIRATALSAQIESAKYDEDHLVDAIQLVLRGKNDQDPVREAMIAALLKIPASRWTEDHLMELAQIIRQGLDVGDLSHGTLQKLYSLISEILPRHPYWAIRQLQILGKERDKSFYIPAYFKSTGALPMKETMRQVAGAMSSTVAILVEKKLNDLLISLAHTFGKFTPYWNELLDLLEKILDEPEVVTTVEQSWRITKHRVLCHQILSVLKDSRPETHWKLVPQLVERRSFLAENGEVVRHVHLYRQDLLVPYFTPGDALYDSGKIAFRGLTNGFDRWSFAQQRMLAQALTKEIDDAESCHTKERNIEQLGLLSFIGVKYLVRYADDKDPIVREAAMRALGRYDGDAGVPLLIEALQDERARIAIYALRSIFRRMTNSEVLRLLKLTPMNKVTVAKEVIRLIGDINTLEALQYLLVLEKTDLHKDVRTALLRALWSFVEFDEAWQIFERAAKDLYAPTAKAVSTIPEDGMSTKARRRLLNLLLQLLNHPAAEVRVVTLSRCNIFPIQDNEEILVSRLYDLIESPIKEEATAAAAALFRTYAKTKAPLIAASFTRALNNRSALMDLFNTYLQQTSYQYGSGSDYHTATHLICSVLAQDRLTVSLRLQLIFNRTLSGLNEFRSLLLEIIPELHADALVETERSLDALARNHGCRPYLQGLEEKLAGNADERARRLAVVLLVGGVSSNKGWTDEERARLRFYAEDESVLVASAAAFVFPPKKEDEDIVMS